MLDLFECNNIVYKGIGVGIMFKSKVVKGLVLDLFGSNSIVYKRIGVGSV